MEWQYIFPLLFFKRLSDVYDEETDEALKAAVEEAGYQVTEIKTYEG